MPTKAEYYAQLADEKAIQLTRSWQEWASFLTTAARLYKYPYYEQLLIYAQRPEATACADYSLWNNRMGRYVRRGSKGIALVDASGDQLRLRYVFDVQDTGRRPNSRTPYLWQMRPEDEQPVQAMLEDQYSVPGSNGLAQQFADVAAQLTEDYWNDNKEDILRIVDDSFLEGYDEDNISLHFKSAATVSITYALMSRCGMEPGEFFDHEDFMAIFDFNTPATVGALGTAVSQINQQLLRQIGVIVQNLDRQREAEQRNAQTSSERSVSNETDLSTQRRLPDSQFDPGPAAPASGQVRQDAEALPAGASPGAVQRAAENGAVVPPAGGDGPDSPAEAGTDDPGIGKSSGGDRADESGAAHDLGGTDEQLQGTGRGDNSEGTGVRITEPEIVEQFTFFPSEAEQIQMIDEGSGVIETPDPFVLSQADIDAELRRGTGFEDGKLRVYAMYKNGMDTKEAVAFLKKEYGIGGHSHTYLDGTNGLVQYDGKGMQFQGFRFSESKRISWTAVHKRLTQLIQEGSYLTEAELERYRQRERANAGLVNQPATADAQNTLHPPMQEDVDNALQEWNGDIASKRRVERYMQAHGRERGTATWLRQEYGDDLPAFPITAHQVSTDLPWSQVQRRLAQLVREERFFTDYEYDTLANVDPYTVRANLTAHGIVNGEVVDREALENSPFIRQVTADVERIAVEEQDEQAPPPNLSDQPITRQGDALTIGEGEQFHEVEVTVTDEQWEQIQEAVPETAAHNFRITDEHLGEGGAKTKFARNVEAIQTLFRLEQSGRAATPEEQQVLSQYVGWGGLADAFDRDKPQWAAEYDQLKGLLPEREYEMARASTLNAHYTSPTVIHAIYEVVERMGFRSGNILEPSCGVGNFFGLLPESMNSSRLYGVELDSVSGRIAQKLYPEAQITVAGFETTDRRDFYDLAVGNVPFGQYTVNDRIYNKLGFSIHNYFFAKSLDQVRPGGVVAFVTSRYTMDAKSPEVRKYLAQRAELLGAIRLPNNAFRSNAGTDVVSDIIFLQKREHPIDIEPDWVHLGLTEDGFTINSYFVDHPEMVLGRASRESTQYGREEYTVEPIEGLQLADQLHDAVKYIHGTYQETSLPELDEGTKVKATIPADPEVKNYSFTLVDGQVYFRENSVMVRPEMSATAEERVRGLIGLRNCVNELIELQMDETAADTAITEKQSELNRLYDAYTKRYGLINERGNRLAFQEDSSYYLLCALEVLDEDGKLERKADMFTKRTIKPHRAVTTVDTASEALAVSIAERAKVDLPYMATLLGREDGVDSITEELRGVIFKDPAVGDDPIAGWQTSDEYLSGNVRRKLREAQRAARRDPAFEVNVEALQAAQPKDLDASEIEVRLGATWIDKEYIRQFMYETFLTPNYLRGTIDVNYVPYTAEWQVKGKNTIQYHNVAAYTTYGTSRANAYKILEDSLNLRDVRIYDTVEDPDGKERRVLNAKETTLAAQKQQLIRAAFKDWIWKEPERRQALVRQYNEEMNSTRPREYDGSHLVFYGMNPEIQLREHQKNAIAHIIFGGNTLLAHEVGAGKTFEMVAAAMEAKRLGLCQKSIFVVPNHLTEQWASEYLRLYPSANILVTTKRDFETHRRKKFCARIATGDYDAIIIGHSQFEKIPISKQRQERLLREQIEEITQGIEEVEDSGGERFTVKQLERTRKSLQSRLEKLQADHRHDDVITFEQLGVDRLFVDEAHSYKNMFLYTKMRNVAGLSTTDAQKSSDMFAKCRYMDEITGSRGTIFATGTPVSNSMTELFTMQRYLQYERLNELDMVHFDCWASRFGETTTALELAPEGTGYRARTRFSRFFNLPELMNLFKEVADIKVADQLNLPTPDVEYHNIVAKPTEHQKEMVKALSERAALIHSGTVDPSRDNMLKVTSDGRKLGLDQRIINPMLPDEQDTKVNQCVSNIVQIYREGEADKLTQLVFCDISTPRARAAALEQKVAKAVDNPIAQALVAGVTLDAPEPEFTVYEDIRRKLMAQGIPEEEIAFIHEANTEVRKKELFAKVRSGQVRVLIGSTAKMGAGTNCQDRLVALHDLDCPWRPGDLEQRKGRIVRQGNQNKQVHIYRYVTEGTFDAYLWQTVENKQRFISQIMTSKSPVRACEDVDETALSYAEIKALCAGDPRIKERMDLDVEVSRLKLMKADHQSQQYRLEDRLLRYYPEEIEKNQGFIKGLQSDLELLAAHPLPREEFVGMEVRGDVLTDKENAGAALLDACKDITCAEPVNLGSYRGLSMSVEFDAMFKQYHLLLKGEMSHRVELGVDPRGNLIRIENVLNQIPDRIRAITAQLDNLFQQQEAAKNEVGKPFPQETELREKSARLVELDAELNMDGSKRSVHDQTMISKMECPSVLERLKRYCPVRAGQQKTRQYAEVL